MAITSNSYTGNGSTTLYSFTFPYLDTADVKVSLNGTVTTAYTFANATTIQFTTAPGAGVAIRIYRETDDTALEAVFSPGSSIRASDLNSDFDQLLYLGQESNNIAEGATTTANTALTTANTAISTANAATSTANTALSNSATAVSTANTASTNASNAVTTANTASSNASAAVTTANAATVTANSAASTAATALSTANTASSNASAAVSTANTASTNASNAVTTANTALSTANTASSNASTAVTTANNAVSTANGAVSTANTALSTANAAISAVASAVIYTPVANLTALAALTPSNGDYFELTDSTGAEGSALITGVTVGLVGAPGLTFRLRYDAPPGIFTFLGYFANDSETRYLKLAGGTLTGQLRGDDSTSASTPGFAFDGDPNTGIGRPGADELALITGGTARLTIDPAGAVAVAGSLSQGGNAVVVTTDSRLSDTRVPTDGSVTNAKVAAAAAIDGTKISPNFGSQNVVTTGTVSGASLIPTSSSVPTNGVYLPSANNVAISTNGSGRLFVDSTGRVGVNTSSPTTVASRVIHVSAGAGESSALRVTGNAGTGLDFIQSLNGDGFIYQRDNNPLIFGTNNLERLRITAAGLVGIGTTSPAEAFTLGSGNAQITSGQLTVGVTSSSGLQFINDGTFGTLNSIPLILRTASAERARIDTSGRFLVGTSTARSNLYNASVTPDYQFETASQPRLALISSNSSADFGGQLILAHQKSGAVGGNTAVASGDDTGRISFQGSDGSEFVETARINSEVDGTPGANDMPGRLVFSTTADGASSPTERMRITESGFSRFTKSGSYNDSGVGNNHYFQNDLANNGVLILTAYNNSFDNVVQQNTCLRAANTAYSFFRGVSGNGSTSFADNEFNLRGNGNGECDGSWTGGGADYAEYFEWLDSNPDAEDRRGISVVLDGDKIREAVAGEDPIGVISGNPSVVGDAAWNKWNGKYLRDEFGSYLLDENGDRQLSPDFDSDQEYVPREQRPEWDCVGLMGKLRIRKGQITGSRWIKMRDISDSVEEWLVR